MRARIIKIGNSQGIRIPKLLLEQSGIGDEIELEVQKDRIIIRQVRNVRVGWEEAFRRMAANGDDQLLDGNLVTQSSWDEKKWEW
jgi:antitoxin MazE